MNVRSMYCDLGEKGYFSFSTTSNPSSSIEVPHWHQKITCWDVGFPYGAFKVPIHQNLFPNAPWSLHSSASKVIKGIHNNKHIKRN